MLHASFVVQVVMIGLLAVSVVSWSMIFGKVFGLKRVRTLNDSFEREFWSGKNLAELNQAAGAKHTSAPMERIFASGMREFLKLRERRARRRGAARRRAPRDARQLPARARRHRRQPRLPRLGGFGEPVRRVCSAPCGASCMRSSACPTCSR